MAWVVSGEFRKLWIGQLVSASGSAITTVALPLVAVVTLQASAVQMGALSALTIAPHLVFGLLAGVWVDRWPLRSVLIWTDLGRLVLLGSVPALAALDMLRIEQLYAVAVLSGVLTLLSDTASQTMIPSLVQRADLMRANSAALLNLNLASTVGPSVAGFLVQVRGVGGGVVPDPRAGPSTGAEAVGGPAVGRAASAVRQPTTETARHLGGGRCAGRSDAGAADRPLPDS
jgi:hypothetical protein